MLSPQLTAVMKSLAVALGLVSSKVATVTDPVSTPCEALWKGTTRLLSAASRTATVAVAGGIEDPPMSFTATEKE